MRDSRKSRYTRFPPLVPKMYSTTYKSIKVVVDDNNIDIIGGRKTIYRLLAGATVMMLL